MRVRKHPQVPGGGPPSLGRYDEVKGPRVTQLGQVRSASHRAQAGAPPAVPPQPSGLPEPRGRGVSRPATARAASPRSARRPPPAWHAAFPVGGQAAAGPAPLSRAPRKWSRGGAGAGSGRGRRRRRRAAG